MADYAIGDIQGCFSELEALLKKINFNETEDKLWFAGDLVNRGPQSLETLRFVKSLGKKHIFVLGNHDMHLLAVAFGARESKKGDTLQDILNASDEEELLSWLIEKPLMHFDIPTGFVIAHAGIAPMWTLDKAVALAAEVVDALRTDPESFFKNMYNNIPDMWRDELEGYDRLRCIMSGFESCWNSVIGVDDCNIHII